MSRVTRTRDGSSDHNTLTVVPVELVFQRWPGAAGSRGSRCISGVAYEVLVAGAVVATGTTGSDGTVTVGVPAGQTATVRIFGTEYELTPIRTVEPLVDVNTATMMDGDQNNDLIPISRRLEALGYDIVNPVDGIMDLSVDRAILEFQVDAKISVDGIAGPQTRGKLRDKFGG